MSSRITRQTRSATKQKDDDQEEHPEYAAAHRQRGRAPKGGETTKIAGSDAASAAQLEDDLTRETDKDVKSRKQKRAVSDGSTASKKKPKHLTPDDSTDGTSIEEKLEALDNTNSTGKNYWLMKAEQEDREVIAHSGKKINTRFTIDDLQAKSKPEPWDGVRNLVARNNMRAMKKGDLAFFYASGGTGKLKPGITGIMEVVKEHEADFTMEDEDAYGYVEPEKRGTDEKPQWSVVYVEYRQKLDTPVSLKEMQQYKDTGEPLEGMQVLTHSRLSVTKVTESQWKFIMDELVAK